MDSAYEATCKHLQATPELAARFDTIAIVVNQVLFETAPSDLPQLTKLGFFPYGEANTEEEIQQQRQHQDEFFRDMSRKRSAGSDGDPGAG